MKKKNPTKKDILQRLDEITVRINSIMQKILYIDQLFGLYLECEGKTETFDKFVKDKVEAFERKQTESEKGA